MYINIKNSLDKIFSLLLLLILSPLFGIVFILIKIFDPGPIFFKQERVGKDEKVFLIYKFRTMIVNADKVGPVLTQDNDPRITKLGYFLRHSSIDELPQFINVLKGEMSIIGPRPEVTSIVNTYNNRQREVFKVKPGITGWAQVHGRDSLTIEEKSVYDIEYVNNISLLLDVKIFLLTFPTLLSKQGIN
jgi:undecaprenyl phosphate N,N'-diacetylbacillosamine 1-phosphate transferase